MTISTSDSADRAEAVGPSFRPRGPEDNLLNPLQHWSTERPDHVVAATRCDDGAFVDVTARQLRDTVVDLAKGLMAMGVEKGDRVALLSATSLAWVQLDHAIMAIGAIAVPIYETSSPDQVSWILEDTQASVVLVAPSLLTTAIQAEVTGPTQPRADPLVIDKAGLDEISRRGATVPDIALEQRLGAIAASDLATIIYTSGTTGRPKGCMLTHANLRANVHQIDDALGDSAGADDTALVFLPLAHVLSKITVLYCLERGIKIAFGTGIASLSEELELVQPTLISAVPRIFEKVYAKAQHKAKREHKERIFERAARVAITQSRERHDGHVRLGLRAEHAVYDRLVYRKIVSAFGGRLRLAFCGGAPLGEHLTSFFDGVGIRIYEGYGLTETSPIVTIGRSEQWYAGSVGLAVAGTQLRVGENSELLVQGPQVFQGYWRNPDATKAAIDEDGWFHTGDIARIDEHEVVRITGRTKDIIVTAGGKNIAPAPLEDLLRPHALVSQAMVLGDGRPFVSALITLDEDGVRDWAQEHHMGGQISELIDHPALRSELQRAVDRANSSVSKGESIRKFAVLPHDFSLEMGEVTPTLKVKRELVLRDYAHVIESMYTS